ncbi:MAG: U32 family peptidase [Lachnospiraceae bacterium]|nr:U32 family peptidase [Lachnospiraceae bacterium]
MNKPEILAPAGSFDALVSAINAGADAIYLGGQRFGARAYAGNFSDEELLEAIEYAHLYGVKVYLTVNTLFRDDEIKELYFYLNPLYIAGLDAVIVQDIGVISFIHEQFPKLPIHASTQMTITSDYAYGLLKDYGVTRIVPARELSLDELKGLKDGNGCPEVEVFVQGALCICYSGQCFMSSYFGGRSGNRGRCAGSCRLPYKLMNENGKSVDVGGDYVLSMKDLCGVDYIKKLVEAGVDSFKIEGRMKNPQYVAACVESYRKCVDDLFDKNDNSKKDFYKKRMAAVFNRGGFTDGYYERKNGRDMLSFFTPGHMGMTVGKITGINKNVITIKLSDRVNKGDIFTIGKTDITLTSNVEAGKGESIKLNTPGSRNIRTDMILYRMLDKNLDEELTAYGEGKRKIDVEGKVYLNENDSARIDVRAVINENEYSITHEGGIVETASKAPISVDMVRDKVGKTGDSEFVFSNLDIEISDMAFYPLKELKNLRRDALKALKDRIVDSYKRDTVSEIDAAVNDFGCEVKNASSCTVMVSDYQQLDTAKKYGDKVKICVDLQFFSKEVIIKLMGEHPEYIYALPYILRKSAIVELNELPIKECQSLVVRSYDEISYLKSIGYAGRIITDYNVYTMNSGAYDFIKKACPDCVVTLPVELNRQQLESLHLPDSEMVVYGYQPLMVMATCMKDIADGCKPSKDGHSFILKDRKNKTFRTRTVCKYCYNVIYNEAPTVLYDVDDAFMNNYSGSKRLHFTIESQQEMSAVIDSFLGQCKYDGELTRGHYKRGVL